MPEHNHGTRLNNADLACLLNRVDNNRVDRTVLEPFEIAALTSRADLIGIINNRWRRTPEGTIFAKANDPRLPDNPVDANQIWILVRKLLNLSTEETMEACKAVGLSTTRSQIVGWRKSPIDRKHTKMSLEELKAVLQGILETDEYYQADEDDNVSAVDTK